MAVSDLCEWRINNSDRMQNCGLIRDLHTFQGGYLLFIIDICIDYGLFGVVKNCYGFISLMDQHNSTMVGIGSLMLCFTMMFSYYSGNNHQFFRHYLYFSVLLIAKCNAKKMFFRHYTDFMDIFFLRI